MLVLPNFSGSTIIKIALARVSPGAFTITADGTAFVALDLSLFAGKTTLANVKTYLAHVVRTYDISLAPFLSWLGACRLSASQGRRQCKIQSRK